MFSWQADRVRIRSEQGPALTSIASIDAEAESTPVRDAENHQLLWTSHASVRLKVGSSVRTCRRPMALWIPARQKVTFVDGVAWCCMFDASTCPASWNRIVSLQLDPVVEALLVALQRRPSRSWANAIASVIVDELLDTFIADAIPVVVPRDPRARKVAESLLEDPSLPWDLQRWGHEVGSSARTLRRLFHEDTGMTFVQWRTRVRVQRALQLLEQGASRAEMLSRTGYSNSATLARVIKTETGLTPTELSARSSTADAAALSWPKSSTDWPTNAADSRQAHLSSSIRELEREADVNGSHLRKAMLSAAGALLVAACGSDDDANSQPASTAETTATTDPSANTETTMPDSGTRTVDDAFGEVELPATYERPVPTDGIWAANMISLGIEPAALPGDVKDQLATVRDYLPSDFDYDDLPEIGIQYDINAEALAAATPDLIIATEFEGEEGGQDIFNGIAPTFFVPRNDNGEWQHRFRIVAKALNASDRVAEIEAAYETRITRLSEGLSDKTIAFVRASAIDDIRVDVYDTSFPGSVALGAGLDVLDLTDQREDENASWLDVAEENLDLLADADIIILGDNSFYDATLSPSTAVLTNSPLWEALPAVQAGAVVEIPGPVYNGGTYQSATALLDAIEQALGQ